MQTRFTGTAHVFGDSIDTDMIMPGKYLQFIEAKELAKYVLEGADPTFAKRVKPGDIVVAGENFGCGSSREHAPVGLKGAGVAVVVAQSFARIFYRNAINIGLPVLEASGVARVVRGGDVLQVDLAAGTVRDTTNGESLQATPLSKKALEILEAGGLVALTRRKLAASKV
ncbi:MAG: 3-isopropylmalate dehydratase small subunit [Methanobacteriota archaeon]